MHAGEIYVPIPVNLADEPAVAALRKHGRDARALRDLYVQLLAYCKRTLSDGFVPAEQVGLLVYPDSPKIGDRDMKRLADAGLVNRAAGGGWFVPAYLEDNPTRAQVGEASAGKARGVARANHQRWHVERGESDPECGLCQAVSQYGDQITDKRTDSALTPSLGGEGVSANGISDSTRQDNPRGKPTPIVPSTSAGDGVCPVHGTDPHASCRGCGTNPRTRGTNQRAEHDDPDWPKLWDVYPRKQDKKPAFAAWKRARKRAEPVTIIAGAERYAAQVAREGREKKHIKLPATWLNNDCWTNEDEDDGPAGQLTYSNSPWEN